MAFTFEKRTDFNCATSKPPCGVWRPGSLGRPISGVGDREFQDVAFQTFVRDDLGWHFVQRLDQRTWIYPRGRRAFKLRQSGLRPGEYRSFGRVQVTRQRLGWVELIAYWRPRDDEPWYLISDKTVGPRHSRFAAAGSGRNIPFEISNRTAGRWKTANCLSPAASGGCC